jgi:hypothetical protein
MSRAEGQIRARFGTGSRYDGMDELTSGETTVGTEETEDKERRQSEHVYSRTRNETRQWPIAGTQRGKSDRRVIRPSSSRSAMAGRCRLSPDAHRERDPGPTFRQTTPRPIYPYEATTGPRTHLQHCKSRHHGSSLVAATPGHPLGGIGKAASIAHSRATSLANMVYSS